MRPSIHMYNLDDASVEDYCRLHWDQGEITVEDCAKCGLTTKFKQTCIDVLKRKKA